MKKLKPISMLITSFAVMVSCIVPSFSTAKAEALTPGTVGSYGSYYAETYQSNNNQQVFTDMVIDLGFIQFNMNQHNCSCFHYHYDFKNNYSGQLSLTVSSGINYILNDCTFTIEGGHFDNIPVKTTSSSSKTFVIVFENVPYIDFYLYHNGTSANSIIFQFTTNFTATFNYMTPHDSEIELLEHIDDVQMMIYDYMTEDMETSFQNIINAINNSVDYEIPQERLYAYFMTKPNDNYPIVYNNGDFAPYIHVTGGNSATRIYRATAGKTFYFYYFSSNTTESLSSPNGVTVVNKNIDPVLNGYRLKCAEITNNTQNDINDSLTWSSNANIIPVYFGDGKDMTQEMQSLTHHQSETYTTSILTQILNAIRSLTGENLYDTSTYDNTVDDAGDFMDNVVNTLPSVSDVQSDINALPSFDPTDSNFKLDDMAGFTNYVYVQMTNVFPFLKTFVILGLIVILMKVFL